MFSHFILFTIHSTINSLTLSRLILQSYVQRTHVVLYARSPEESPKSFGQSVSQSLSRSLCRLLTCSLVRALKTRSSCLKAPTRIKQSFYHWSTHPFTHHRPTHPFIDLLTNPVLMTQLPIADALIRSPTRSRAHSSTLSIPTYLPTSRTHKFSTFVHSLVCSPTFFTTPPSIRLFIQ